MSHAPVDREGTVQDPGDAKNPRKGGTRLTILFSSFATSSACNTNTFSMKSSALSLLFLALLAGSAVAQSEQDKRGLLDGLPLVGGLLNGGNGGILGLPIGSLLGGLPIGSLLSALPIGGLLGGSGGANGGSILDNILGQQLIGSILGGILGGKGVAVAAAYSSATMVHANVAANIAIDLPTQVGLLTPITGLLGSVLPISSILPGVFSTTTILNVQAGVDVSVSVGLCADIKVALPAGTTPLFTSGLVYASAQVGLRIDVSAEVLAAVSLITPVLQLDSNAAGLLKFDGQNFSQVASFVNKDGRMVAQLDPKAVAGTYIFVSFKANI
ncbi:hypothetical protein PROFUN_12946 [Planoprotostelium fungivorum]|uniref:Uncharacterized protein n=1 Tax=Planoprotostelium fungivorum TaxID=1890364 RepID=A0A2P6N5X1_9EUKA|nr:hypothetical protein PROFUN_12946 [Planoprotostelium fungivorum]